MLSIFADVMMTATRQNSKQWPDQNTQYADRFTSDPHRKEQQRNRRHNLFSYFQ